MKTQLFRRYVMLSLVLLFTGFYALGAYAQSIVVTGTVKDNQGEMPGVNIQVKGSDIGTITNIDGFFSVNVHSTKAVLVISYIGYVAQEITVGIQTSLNIIMSEDREMLDGVVVVGNGVQ